MSLPVGILLIRSWTADHAAITDRLREIGLDPTIVRVDHEPALNAALHGSRFDVAIYDPMLPNVSRDVVERLLREHAPTTPLVRLDGLDTLGEAVQRALGSRRN